MALEIGAEASILELKARWAFAEAQSPRWRDHILPRLPISLLRPIEAGQPFERFDRDEQETLASALTGARNEGFLSNLEKFGAPTYVLTGWSVDDLLHSFVLPTFGAGIRYFRFLALPPKQGDKHDPRFVARSVPDDPARPVGEPPISIKVNGDRMLIEGYLRSILWLRYPNKPLLVWEPKDATK